MSRWLVDEIHIALSPTQLGLVRMQRKLGLKGIIRQEVARESLGFPPDSLAPVWDNALQTMDRLLPKYAEGRPDVVVVLSNQFVHYALVPWSDLISSEEQQLDYARHCFQQTYGALSAGWQIRLSRATVGSAQLASAVDEKLLSRCDEVVRHHGLRLTSVQPYFMSAFNRLNSQILHTDAWFALAEPGNICLARLHQGQWVRFRSARLAGGWEEFSRFLVREAFMGDSELQAKQQVLYLYAPHLGKVQTISGWEIIELPPPLSAQLPLQDEASLIMALSG